ncbi:hypothetical protein JOC76_001905 [Neobacillus cucumis]|nr:hypothetical protein [Neobacillus cucumis]
MFRSDVNWDEGFKQEDLAKQKIKKEATQSGLLKTAEDNARLALQDFLKNQIILLLSNNRLRRHLC